MLRSSFVSDSISRWLVPCGLLVLITGGSAWADGHGEKEVDPNIKYRQSLMSAIGANMGSIGDILKHQLDRPGAIANHAGQMADAAALIAPAFRDRVTAGPTDARPAIWKDWAKFEQAVADYEAAAKGLASAASGGDPAAIGAAMKQLGKSCGTCHKPFRKKNRNSYKRKKKAEKKGGDD